MSGDDGENGYPYLHLAGAEIYVFLPDGVYVVERLTPVSVSGVLTDRASSAVGRFPLLVSPFGHPYALRRIMGAGEHEAFCRLFLFDSLRALAADVSDALSRELLDYALRAFAAMLRATLPTPTASVGAETTALPADAPRIAELTNAFPDDQSSDGALDGVEGWLADSIAECLAVAPPQPTRHLFLLGRFQRLVETPSLQHAHGEFAVLAPTGEVWLHAAEDHELRARIRDWWHATRMTVLRARDRARRAGLGRTAIERPSRREIREHLLRTGSIETRRLVLIHDARECVPAGYCYVGWRMPAHFCRSLSDRPWVSDGELALCSPLMNLPDLPRSDDLALFRRTESGAWQRVWPRSSLCPGPIARSRTPEDPRALLVAHLQAVAERFYVNGRMHEHDV